MVVRKTTPSGGSAYAAMGFGGQLIIVVPEHRPVVAVASNPTKDRLEPGRRVGNPSPPASDEDSTPRLITAGLSCKSADAPSLDSRLVSLKSPVVRRLVGGSDTPCLQGGSMTV